MEPNRRSVRSWWDVSHYARSDDADGHWITIGSREDESGEKHGGSPVFVKGGRVVKGAPGLVGRHLDNLKGPAEEASHRKELHQEKQYQAARWAKRAREAGINPSDLSALAQDLMRHDAAHLEDRKSLLKDARDTLRRNGYDPGFLTHRLRTGRVEDSIPGFDELVAEMQKRYPSQFAGHDDPEARLLDLLTEGNPQPMTSDEAFETALSHLQEHGPSGSEVSGEPLFDDEDEPERPSWETASTEPAGWQDAKVKSAWERYLHRGENAKGGGLFGGEDLQARRGFAKLPDGAPVLFVQGDFAGRTGKIVHDSEHQRIVAEVDGRPGLVPVDPSSIEPLAAHQSWRTDTASGDFSQKPLFDSGAFLPRRQDDEDSVPFNRQGEQTMPAQTLTRQRFNARCQRVSRYARDMGIDSLDADQYGQAEALDTLLDGADPAELESRLQRARQDVQRGTLTVDEAVSQLLARIAPTGVPDAQKNERLGRLFRRAIETGESLGEAAASIDDDDSFDVNSLPTNELRRMQRDSNRVRHYARTGEVLRPGDMLDFTKQDLDAALAVMGRKKCDFDTACKQIGR
jgi:hypothetical protein